MHPANIAAALLSAFALFPQERPPAPRDPPKDAIIITGCLKYPVVEDLENRRAYRLTGKKDMLRDLQKEHAGHVDEIIGTLKSSTLGLSETREKQFGKTRVKARVGEVSGEAREAERVNAIPEISVTSYRHLGRVCSS